MMMFEPAFENSNTLLKALAREHPDRAAPVPKGINRVQTFLNAASRHYGIPVAEIISPRVEAHLVRARQIVMYLSYRTSTMSLPKIALHIGDRDHSTILHGVRKIRRLIQFDDQLADDVAAIQGIAAEADHRLGALV